MLVPVPRPAAFTFVCLLILTMAAPLMRAQSVTTDSALNSEYKAFGSTAKPTQLLADDFNNDSVPDVAVLSRTDQSVTIHRFDRSALSFKAGQRQGLSAEPLEFAVGDFDADGSPDVAVAHPSAVAILRGNGDGTLTASPERYLDGQTLLSIDSGDLNGDGAADLVVGHLGGVTALVNNGSGAFNEVPSALPAEHGDGYSVRVGHFDGNSTPDIAVFACCRTTSGTQPTTSFFYRVYTLTGDGNGGFGNAQALGNESGLTHPDGEITVLPGTTGGRYSVFLSQYAGTAQELYENGKDAGGVLYRFAWNSELGTYQGTTDNDPGSGLQPAGAVRGITGRGASWTGVGKFTSDGATVRLFDAVPGASSSVVRIDYLGPTDQILSDAVQADFDGDSIAEVVVSDYAGGRLFAHRLGTVPAIACDATGLSGNGVKICAPADGATVSNPFRLVARAWATYGGAINYYRAYVDGVQVYFDGRYGTPQKLDATLRLKDGTRTIKVEAGIPGLEPVSTTRTVMVSNSTDGDSGATCAPPTTAGVKICTPSNGATVTSPARIVAAAASSTPVRYMQVWVDGTKVFHQEGDRLDTSLTLSDGERRVVVTARDEAGATLKSTIYVTAGGESPAPTPTACAAPTTSRTIAICQPVNESSVGSPVRILASSSGTPKTMKVYVDGSSAYSTSSSTIDTALPMSAGRHRVTVKAWDSGGTYSQTIYVTVGETSDGGTGGETGGGGGSIACPAPTTNPQVVICAPSDGTSSASPIRVVAQAHSSKTVKTMKIYLDGTSVYTVSGSALDTSIAAAAGKRRITVKAWHTDGTSFSDTIYVTVQ